MSADSHKSGTSLLLWFLLPTIVIGVAGGIWFYHGKASKASSQADGNTKVRDVLHLETFVLNLDSSDQRAYLRVGIDLGLAGEPKSRQSESVPVALVRDTILSVLSSAKPDEILTAAGKQTLKGNLRKALQQRVPELQVEDVYFTEFLIQR